MSLEVHGVLARQAEARSTHQGEAVLRVAIAQQGGPGCPGEIVCDLTTGSTDAHHIACRLRAAQLVRGTQVVAFGAGLYAGHVGPMRTKVLRLAGCSQIATLGLPQPHHEPRDPREAKEPAA